MYSQNTLDQMAQTIPEPPLFVILNVDWIKEVHRWYPVFFDKFSLYDIIEKLTSINSLVNVNRLLMFNLEEIFWEDINSRFSEKEIDALSIDCFTKLVNFIMARLYFQLKIHVSIIDEGESDYVFEKWLDETSLILRRYDTTILIDRDLLYRALN